MEPVENNTPSPMLTNRMYDWIKKAVQIVLPATATLYFTLATIFGWPWAEQVVATLAAIATFFGTILGLSAKSYNESGERYIGETYIGVTEEGPKRVFNITSNPEDFQDKREMVFKVLE